MLYMFRTVLVHQEQLYKLYIAFGIWWYHTCSCCVAIAPQQLQVWYRLIPNATCSLKVAPDDGLIQSETYRASNGK